MNNTSIRRLQKKKKSECIVESKSWIRIFLSDTVIGIL